MKNSLLFRLEAPMQSWGISSQFTERDTAREPSKSGVIGLVCAALGRSRDADLNDLAALRMGVRVDREGILSKDFQVAQNILQADGKKIRDNPEISNRYYLSDAVFLVGLEGEEDVLRTIQKGLKDPEWTLYLGRKAFPPSKPVYLEDGLKNECLIDALTYYPDLTEEENNQKRIVIEAENGQFLRKDVPINFSTRKFSNRRIEISYINIKKEGMV